MLLARLIALAKATIYTLWCKSVVLDLKQRDLAMSRYLGPNR